MIVDEIQGLHGNSITLTGDAGKTLLAIRAACVRYAFAILRYAE